MTEEKDTASKIGEIYFPTACDGKSTDAAGRLVQFRP